MSRFCRIFSHRVRTSFVQVTSFSSRSIKVISRVLPSALFIFAIRSIFFFKFSIIFYTTFCMFCVCVCVFFYQIFIANWKFHFIGEIPFARRKARISYHNDICITRGPLFVKRCITALNEPRNVHSGKLTPRIRGGQPAKKRPDHIVQHSPYVIPCANSSASRYPLNVVFNSTPLYGTQFWFTNESIIC